MVSRSGCFPDFFIGNVCSGSQTIKRIEVLLDEVAPQQQVARRITTRGEFRKDDQINTRFHSALISGQNFRFVAGDVADGGVDLRERNFHLRELPQKNTKNAKSI